MTSSPLAPRSSAPYDPARKQRKDAHLWVRHPHDWYVEPTASTRELLIRETFPGWSHDPCCGRGNIVQTLADAGLTVTGSDIVKRTQAPWFLGEADYYDGPMGLWGADNCVSNFPYYSAVGTERGIRLALDLAPGKVAAFVDSRFLFSGKRARGLYHEHPPSRVWMLGNRPSCPPGPWLEAGNEAGGGEKDFCWLVWDALGDRRRAGSTSEMGWLV